MHLNQKISFYQVFFFFLIFFLILKNGLCNFWEKPGCHLVIQTRKYRIPNCVEFEIDMNVCRGYCDSYSIPSSKEVLSINSNQIISSFGQCCNIKETVTRYARVRCKNGIRVFTFKSAKTCSCFHCEKF